MQTELEAEKKNCDNKLPQLVHFRTPRNIQITKKKKLSAETKPPKKYGLVDKGRNSVPNRQIINERIERERNSLINRQLITRKFGLKFPTLESYNIYNHNSSNINPAMPKATNEIGNPLIRKCSNNSFKFELKNLQSYNDLNYND